MIMTDRFTLLVHRRRVVGTVLEVKGMQPSFLGVFIGDQQEGAMVSLEPFEEGTHPGTA